MAVDLASKVRDIPDFPKPGIDFIPWEGPEVRSCKISLSTVRCRVQNAQQPELRLCDNDFAVADPDSETLRNQGELNVR